MRYRLIFQYVEDYKTAPLVKDYGVVDANSKADAINKFINHHYPDKDSSDETRALRALLRSGLRAHKLKNKKAAKR